MFSRFQCILELTSTLIPCGNPVLTFRCMLIQHKAHTSSSCNVYITRLMHTPVAELMTCLFLGMVYSHPSVLHEISKLLNTNLDAETLTTCVRLLETGVNPEALVSVVQELRREALSLQVTYTALNHHNYFVELIFFLHYINNNYKFHFGIQSHSNQLCESLTFSFFF